jgi:hypothetical protein
MAYTVQSSAVPLLLHFSWISAVHHKTRGRSELLDLLTRRPTLCGDQATAQQGQFGPRRFTLDEQN